MSILHLAAMHGHFELVKYLMSIEKFIIDDKTAFGVLFFDLI